MKQTSTLLSLVTSPRLMLSSISVLVLITVFGGFFYVHSRNVMEQELRLFLKTTATISALQFDSASLKSIRTPEDMMQPVFMDVVHRLQQIREHVPGITYVYIMRKTDDPNNLQFVADADALKTTAELDRNNNGKVDNDEEASYPGDAYDIADVVALQDVAFREPTVDDAFTKDQWGTTISGYAPIIRNDGPADMILGIDMVADDYLMRAQSIFSPVGLLLLLLAGVLLAIFVAIFLAKRRMEALAEVDLQRTALMTLTTHQLGAPLATFKWWMEIHREREAARQGDDDKEDMQMLQEGVSRMDAIMKSLQEAYEVFAGDIAYKKEEASLKEIIESVAMDLKPVCDSHKQTINLNVETVHEKMQLDPKLVKAVIHELIDNAHTYSKNGGTITVRALRHHDAVEVQVQDEGHGIPAKDLPHIFERFTRGSNAMNLKPVGNGLGLFTAKGIIERAGGKMWIESEEGKGTTVFFTLPVR